MKTFVLSIDAKYNVMVINAETEEEAVEIATSDDIKINPLYSCKLMQIIEVHEVIPNKPGIQFYA